MARRPTPTPTNWQAADVESWMFGADQVPQFHKPLKEMLADRFHIATQSQIQTLQTPLDNFWADRDGLTSASALAKMVQWFTRSSVALCGIWFLGLVLTMYLSENLSESELWAFSLIFVVIALVRFVLVVGLISEGRAQTDRKSDSKAWKRVRSSIVHFAFSYPLLMCLGPAMLIVVGLVIVLTDGTFNPFGLFSLLEPDTLEPGASSFQNALKGAVWALPVIGVGLLRQAYVTLSQLLVERGQVQERLRQLNILEDNWKAGTAFLGTVEEQGAGVLEEQINQLRARFQAQYDRADRQFGAQSATNGALVALISLLGPLDGLEPNTGLDLGDETALLQTLTDEKKERWPEDTTTLASLDENAALDLIPPFKALEPSPCRDLNREELVRAATEEKSFVHQTLLTANLMDCLEKNNKAHADAILKMQIDMAERHNDLLAVVQRFVENQPQSTGNVQNTYVCVFPFSRHCLQNSQVDVSTEGLGKVAFDFNAFMEQVGAAETALLRLSEKRTVALDANPEALNSTLTDAETRLATFAEPRSVRITADTEAAQRNIEALIETEDRLPETHDLTVNADVTDALTALDTVLAKLEALQDADPVTLQANADLLYQEIAFVRRKLDALPKQERVSLFGLLQRPFVNFNIPMSFSGRGGGLPGLASCEFVGSRKFATNAPLRFDDGEPLNDQWSIVGVDPGKVQAKDDLRRLLTGVHKDKKIYVLGTADLQGGSGYNFRLSQARADFVSNAIGKLEGAPKPVALSIGEAGWLTWRGLPGTETDASHRAALVYACDAPEDTPGVTFGR